MLYENDPMFTIAYEIMKLLRTPSPPAVSYGRGILTGRETARAYQIVEKLREIAS